MVCRLITNTPTSDREIKIDKIDVDFVRRENHNIMNMKSQTSSTKGKRSNPSLEYRLYSKS